MNQLEEKKIRFRLQSVRSSTLHRHCSHHSFFKIL